MSECMHEGMDGCLGGSNVIVCVCVCVCVCTMNK